jgi:hypothetical protein
MALVLDDGPSSVCLAWPRVVDTDLRFVGRADMARLMEIALERLQADLRILLADHAGFEAFTRASSTDGACRLILTGRMMSMLSEPLRPELWRITLPAVRAARSKGLAYIASGSYVSRADVPEYETNGHGWSTTTNRDRFSDRKDSPVNWDYMFGHKRGHFAAMAWSEVPELAAAAEQVRELALSDSTLERAVSVLSRTEKDSTERAEQVEFEYVRFVGDIVARAEAIGASSDAELLGIYLQLERARFAAELRGDLMVPIALTALDLDEPTQIGEGVWIEPLDQATQRARAVSPLYEGRISAYVVAAATHAIVLRSVTFPNHDRARRIFGHVAPDLTNVDRVIECLHIATGRDTGYAQVIVRPDGWADDWIHDLPPIWKVTKLHAYPDEFDEGGWNAPQVVVPWEDFQRLPTLYAALTAAPANVQLAARRAMRAVLRADDEDETIDATIGIEALLLANNDRDELTHRMAQRAAAALAGEYEPEVIYRLLKKVYEHRSKIVHGRTRRQSTVNLGDQHYPAQQIATLLLRILLLNLLAANEPWTPEALDARLLAGLTPQTDQIDQASD